MERPMMNKEKMARCMKSGKSRADCMKQIYPKGMPGEKTGKKPAPRSGRY
jgi:hypothetical protein